MLVFVLHTFVFYQVLTVKTRQTKTNNMHAQVTHNSNNLTRYTITELCVHILVAKVIPGL